MKWHERLSSHIETWRPYTSCYVGLVGLAGAALALEAPAGWRLFAAWAIPTVGWLAGLYGGDYFDRELDAVAKPQRPIPSGRLRPGTALGCMITLIAFGAVWTILLNWHALVLVAVATAVGLSYNGFFKARGLAGNLVRGCLTSCAFLFGSMLALDHLSVPLVLVSLVFCFQDSGSNLVGTLRDIDGDEQGGYRTLPVRRGVSVTVRTVGVLVAGWSALALVTPALIPRTPNAAFGVLLAAAMMLSWLVVVLLYRARMNLSRRYALRMHEVLCLERILLAGALLALGGNTGLAIAVAVPALAITWSAQLKLRGRNEFDPATEANPPEATWASTPAGQASKG